MSKHTTTPTTEERATAKAVAQAEAEQVAADRTAKREAKAEAKAEAVVLRTTAREAAKAERATAADARKLAVAALPVATRHSGTTSKRPCLCGCGAETGRFFAQGHDAKLHSLLRKVALGEAQPEDGLDAAAVAAFGFEPSGDGQVPTTNALVALVPLRWADLPV